jgi:hypothetical protein
MDAALSPIDRRSVFSAGLDLVRFLGISRAIETKFARLAWGVTFLGGQMPVVAPRALVIGQAFFTEQA